MASFKNYLSLIKFSHTVFALPFAFIGFFLGRKSLQAPLPPEGGFSGAYPPFGGWGGSSLWKTGGLILLCMVFARTAAMAFNRFTDRVIDAKNQRTRSREIPSGTISSAAALTLVIISS